MKLMKPLSQQNPSFMVTCIHVSLVSPAWFRINAYFPVEKRCYFTTTISKLANAFPFLAGCPHKQTICPFQHREEAHKLRNVFTIHLQYL
jgi:hypothetical protein